MLYGLFVDQAMIHCTTTLNTEEGTGKCTQWKGKQIDTSDIAHLPCTLNVQ